jgi:acetyl esterase/lipase
MQTYNLWDEKEQEDVIVEYYEPLKKSSDAAVIIFPGGGYTWLADHEGKGYAQLLNVFGISAFVVRYRVYPNFFPAPLLDARRAIRFVRFHADKFAINKNKILVMGSSAGGHLAALVSTYLEEIGEPNDVLRQENFLPNGQILCYPLISSD